MDGTGVWFMPYSKLAFSATYGCSTEDHIVSVKAGFFF